MKRPYIVNPKRFGPIKIWINLAYFGIIYSTFDPSRMTSLSPGGAAPAVPPRCWASQVASSVAGGPRGPASHGGTLWSSQGWLPYIVSGYQVTIERYRKHMNKNNKTWVSHKTEDETQPWKKTWSWFIDGRNYLGNLRSSGLTTYDPWDDPSTNQIWLVGKPSN